MSRQAFGRVRVPGSSSQGREGLSRHIWQIVGPSNPTPLESNELVSSGGFTPAPCLVTSRNLLHVALDSLSVVPEVV